jgi:aryl-alcohol dehydrogenase-like predicted oxidoreductase
MQQRRMGRAGLKVSEICLGTMTFGSQCDRATSFRIMDVAFERGVTTFDTADIYPSPPDLATAGRTEEMIGGWVCTTPGRRAQVVLVTKCGAKVGPEMHDQGLSRRHILAACEASLRRLRTDYIDVYLSHGADYGTPLDETLRAFDDLVRSGKVRHVGCSNDPAWRLALALGMSGRFDSAGRRSRFARLRSALAPRASGRNGRTRYDCVQPRYNVLYREIETELLPLCRDQGLGVMVYNPLAGGLLTGKHSAEAPPEPGTRFTLGAYGELYRERYWQSAQFAAVAALKSYCQRRGWNLATASVAWVLHQPAITSAIIGASRPEQLDATLAAPGLAFDDEARSAFDSAWWSIPRRRPVR